MPQSQGQYHSPRFPTEVVSPLLYFPPSPPRWIIQPLMIKSFGFSIERVSVLNPPPNRGYTPPPLPTNWNSPLFILFFFTPRLARDEGGFYSLSQCCAVGLPVRSVFYPARYRWKISSLFKSYFSRCHFFCCPLSPLESDEVFFL